MKPKTRAAELFTALSFLTVLPANSARVRAPDRDSLWAFPLVGVVVGTLGGTVFILASYFGLTSFVCAILVVAAQILLTGALHEDGLADVADGLGGHDGVSRLEIMRDSRTGTFGVLAVILVLSLRIGLIASMPSALDVLRFIVVSGALSRAALPLMILISRPARSDGLGRQFGSPDARGCWAAAILGVAGTFLILPIGICAILIALTVFIVAISHVWTNRWIGGYTGDTLGATQQLLEVSALLALALASAGG